MGVKSGFCLRGRFRALPVATKWGGIAYNGGMGLLPRTALPFLAMLCLVATLGVAARGQQMDDAGDTAKKPSRQKPSAKNPPVSPELELQKAIDSAGNDRAALVRNLEAFLQKYPEAPQRPQIFRALVEANIQLRDAAHAANYAERLIAITPEDISMTILAIQLLERTGDPDGLRRAVTYSTRILDYIAKSDIQDKAPRESPEKWEHERTRDETNVLQIRGRLYRKLGDTASARKDFEESYKMMPNAGAALQLGEMDELGKDYPGAITEYSRAFALSDTTTGSMSRPAIRLKLGNVWRLAHGSETGLGDYLLQTFDMVTSATEPKAKANAGLKEPYEFKLRTMTGAAYPLGAKKGKVIVVNFWATWCGPCRALEPHFERVASSFSQDPDVLFLSADCDEDETLVPAYLDEMKPKTTVVFADGLERLFAVDSFPTVIVLDRTGKVVYRAEGYGEEGFDAELTAAVKNALKPAETQPAPAGNSK